MRSKRPSDTVSIGPGYDGKEGRVGPRGVQEEQGPRGVASVWETYNRNWIVLYKQVPEATDGEYVLNFIICSLVLCFFFGRESSYRLKIE